MPVEVCLIAFRNKASRQQEAFYYWTDLGNRNNFYKPMLLTCNP